MREVYLERSYERPKGPKVVSRIPQAAPDLSFDEEGALDDNFDHLFAVDTNTRVIDGKTISVVGVVSIADVAPSPGYRGQTWQFGVPFCLEYGGLKTKPEPFGWLEALGVLAQEGHLVRGRRIGLIVDSELGALQAFNARTQPVDTGRMLPPGVTLIYASADTGKENLINQALGIADSASAQILAALEAGRMPMASKPASSPLFDTVRIVEPNIVTGVPAQRGRGA
jgi:hypothetical protein